MKTEKSHFDRRLAKQMASIRRRKLFEKIPPVIEFLSPGPPKVEQMVSFESSTSECYLSVAGGTVQLTQEINNNKLVKFIHWSAYYGGQLMFRASCGSKGAWTSKDQRLVLKFLTHDIYVATYRSGIWEKALDLKRLRHERRKVQEATQRAQEKRAREAAAQKPDTEHMDDDTIAQRFAI